MDIILCNLKHNLLLAFVDMPLLPSSLRGSGISGPAHVQKGFYFLPLGSPNHYFFLAAFFHLLHFLFKLTHSSFGGKDFAVSYHF